jgi:hypothetical protein
LRNDGFHFGENAVGEGFLPDFIPEVFRWIEFRRVGRKAVETDVFSNPRAGRGWRRTNHGFLRWARMIPSIWDWQKKAKILQACPFLRIRVHPGNQWFYIILSCNMM